MGSFFAKLGKGLLYILVLPFYLIGLAVMAVVSFFGFVILFIKSIVLFFTGRSLYDDLPEDKLAKEIIAAKMVKPEPTVEKVEAEFVAPIVDVEVKSQEPQIEASKVEQINIVQPEPEQIEVSNPTVEEPKVDISTSEPEIIQEVKPEPEIIEEYKSDSHIFSDIEGDKHD